MRKPIRQRNAEQRLRQQTYRDRLKAERRPSRDDIARMLLHFAITESMRSKKGRSRLGLIEEKVVERLVAQGFDGRASYAVFDDLIERYTRQKWEFRRKPHLSADDGERAGSREESTRFEHDDDESDRTDGN